MALADIQNKSAQERKREIRLVHLTNTLARDYLDSERFKKKPAAEKADAEYTIKSMLDYVFFEEKKELSELQNKHVHNFMLFYAPHKLHLSAEAGKNAPAIITDFLGFLEQTGHIKNGKQLSEEVIAYKSSFLKMMPKPEKSGKGTATKKIKKTKIPKEAKVEVRVGRNDPCPCGSGKKYKKCCGQAK
jgi:hypothetical protein